MVSVFLDNLRQIFGEEFSENSFIDEALTDKDDKNRSLAMIGDSLLDLVVTQKAYSKDKDPENMDKVRQKLADKVAIKDILNQDKEFVEYLGTHYMSIGPQGEIGYEKANRFVEAIIGAVYKSNGFEASVRFTKTILKSYELYHELFPDSDFIVWCRNDPSYHDEDYDYDADSIVYMIFNELESMKPVIIDALKWLKGKPLEHFYEVNLWCTDRYEFLESAKLNICLLEGDEVSIHFDTNVCENDPFYILLSDNFQDELKTILGEHIYTSHDTGTWQENPEMKSWYIQSNQFV